VTDENFAGQSLDHLLEEMATGSGPAAGSAAAIAVAMAAALAAKTARGSRRHLTAAAELRTRAETLRARAVQLASADAAAVAQMLRGSGTADTRPAASTAAGQARPPQAATETPVSDPSATPGAISRVAAQVAELAAQLAEQGNPRLHADALTAGHLAQAAVAGCDAIVASNQG
jgi:formiminotetrahydrofolate cyclodeaminase